MFYRFQKIRGLRIQPFLITRIVTRDVSLGEMSVTHEKHRPYYLHSCCFLKNTLCEVSQNNYTCGKNKIKFLLCPQLVPRGTRTIRHFNKGHVCMHVCSSIKLIERSTKYSLPRLQDCLHVCMYAFINHWYFRLSLRFLFFVHYWQ